MKKWILFAAGLAFFTTACDEENDEPEQPHKTIIHDDGGEVSQTDEVQKAYALINKVRKNP